MSYIVQQKALPVNRPCKQKRADTYNRQFVTSWFRRSNRLILHLDSKRCIVFNCSDRPESGALDDELSVVPSLESTIPDVQASPSTPNDWSWLTTAGTLAQAWAIILPLGYGGLPLLSNYIAGVPGSQAYAALIVEVVVFLGVRMVLKRRGWESSMKFDFSEAFSIVTGILAGFSLLLINQTLFGNSGESSEAYSEIHSIFDGAGLASKVSLFAASVLIAPATEEMLYRGFLIKAFQLNQINMSLSIALSALIFSIGHLQLGAIPQLFVVGTILGSSAVQCRGNIAASFIAHAIYNGTLLISFMDSMN